MITIVDYGAGNIKSIRNMLKKIGVESCISKESKVIAKASKLILPGVGHFDFGMRNLRESGLIEVLHQSVMVNKTPILGICLGAQLFGSSSEEGAEKGLGWLDMEIVKFDVSKIDTQFKIPHMGWNEIAVQQPSKLLHKLKQDARFYFVHSFHMQPKNKEDILTSTSYGYHFASAVKKDNVYGVQFHPEKSHKFGMLLLSNFSTL
jgi:glutamine amidotransferase